MKRVVFLTEFFPPAYGGIQWTSQVAAQALGPDLLVVAPPQTGSVDFDRLQPYSIIRRSLFSGRHWPRWWWLVGWLKKQHRAGTEIVLFGHYSAAVLAGWIVHFFGLRYAVMIHGRDVLVEQRRLPSWLIGSSLRAADWIGVNSTFTGNLVRVYNVPNSKIVATHPAVAVQTINRPSQAPLALITICRLVARKNVANTLQAMAVLRSRFPNLQLQVIGDGSERPALEALALKLGINSQVHFHGWVDEKRKQALLAQSSIAVMVPREREAGTDVEGLGIFYLEAAAHGLPLIASPTGGVRDVVQPAVTGKLVPADDPKALAAAIGQLLESPEQLRQLGQRAHDLVKTEWSLEVRNRRLRALVERAAMAQAPKISVIIPTYQSATTIGETLRDLANQTWPNTEIIVVDDGSTDNLAEAIAAWKHQLLFMQQPHSGAPVARNAGAAKASGEYLLFLDADTRLQPTMLTEMAVALLTHPEATWVYSDFIFGPKHFHLWEYSKKKLAQMNYIHTSSLLRATAFPGFDPSLKKFQDWDLWLTLASQKHQGLWIPSTLFRVQQRAGGMSSWLPKIVYQLPGLGQGQGSATIRKYREAEAVIRSKHQLS